MKYIMFQIFHIDFIIITNQLYETLLILHTNTSSIPFSPITIIYMMRYIIVINVMETCKQCGSLGTCLNAPGISCGTCKLCDDNGNCVNREDGYNDCGSGCQRCFSGECKDYNSACAGTNTNCYCSNDECKPCAGTASSCYCENNQCKACTFGNFVNYECGPGGTACGPSCYNVGDCPGHYLASGLCCANPSYCALAQNCIYAYAENMPDKGQCCEVECNDNGWQLIPKSLTSCGIAGYSYFADICNQGCEIVDDTSKCRSSAYSSDCTAEPECNGKSPGDVLTDLCSWSELKVLRKCSSTCSIEVTYTYICDKNHCGEWRYCGGENYQCIYDGGWLWSANPPSNFCCNDNWCSGYDPN
ncbi:MAG: hypothetical protein QW486_05740, partial [Candidatus Bathyarchaeia archaeon]